MILVRRSPRMGPGLICATGCEPCGTGKGTVGVGVEIPLLYVGLAGGALKGCASVLRTSAQHHFRQRCGILN